MNTRHPVCLVTDRRRLSPGADGAQALDRVVQLVRAAARAGVDLIHIRERDLHARDLTALTMQCVDAAARTASRILVNDRIDVALAAGAHGVHLRSDSIDAVSVRRLVPADFIVGRSVHSAEEAAAAARDSKVDYLIFGTIFSSPSKGPGHTLAGLEGLARATAGRTMPLLAIGGIVPDLAETVARAGADGIAGIGLFIPPAGRSFDAHVEGVVSRLRRAFDTCGVVT